MADVILRRYVLRNDRLGEGWAIIVLGSDGFFSAVSDYGNYGYIWTHHGCADVREFFAKERCDSAYFIGKLKHGQNAFDEERTHDSIRAHILEYRRTGSYSRERAREEWTLLHDCNIRDDGLYGYFRWHEQTHISSGYELAVYSPSSQVVGFCEKVLPRWAEMLRAELAAERQQGQPVSAPA